MMKIPPYKYVGITRIYLQGEEALEPINITQDNALYHLASPQSQIKVKDHRPHVALAAQLALRGKEEDAFAEIFCQPARIQLEAKNDLINIEIFKNEAAGADALTLWMGVIDDNRMAVAKTEWEFLIGIEEPKIAFAALIH